MFHKVITCGLSEVPSGTQIIILSRAEPPPEYARHLANNLIAQIAWQDLRLTPEETCLIATARQPIEAQFLLPLHKLADGWSAGLILILERLKYTGAVDRSVPQETLETVFDYFAGEVFAHLDEGTRGFLLRTCLLPHVTIELANALTGRSDAGDILPNLHRRQLFIDRRLGETVTYQFHALFTRFLRARAKASLTGDE